MCGIHEAHTHYRISMASAISPEWVQETGGAWLRASVLHFNVTANPTAQWTAQQIAEACGPCLAHDRFSGRTVSAFSTLKDCAILILSTSRCASSPENRATSQRILVSRYLARRRSKLSGPAPFATSNRKPPAIETFLRNMIISTWSAKLAWKISAASSE